MLVNTTLFDGEREMPEGTAMAVKSDRIVAIGPFDSLKTLYSTAEMVDGEGAFVIPGLIDAHVHPVNGAEQIGFVQLSGLKSVQNIREAISAYASQKPELELIRGRGWELSVFENGNPSKELLDEIVPDRPAIMVSWDGHSSWVNSKALELAGVNANTPDPKNGRIERLPNGEPSGTLRESAMGLVSSLIPERSFEEHVELMRRGIYEMNAKGITGFIEARTPSGTARPFRKQEERAGRYP
ncbi:MAG: amidohydrolase family protein [Bacteroidetes bacterium]|nr:amidohydrolase family protein [Bacteroidota bacterium]